MTRLIPELSPCGCRFPVSVSATHAALAHLFVETPEPTLVAGMQWLQYAYTRRFNVRHRKSGRLFGDRYSRAERTETNLKRSHAPMI